MPKQGRGRKPKVPQQHKDLLQAWESRESVHYDRQFHNISEDLLTSTLKEVDNFEEEYCEPNRGEGIHLTGTKSMHKAGTPSSEEARLLLLSSGDNPLAKDIKQHLETKYKSAIVQVQSRQKVMIYRSSYFGCSQQWRFSVRHI